MLNEGKRMKITEWPSERPWYFINHLSTPKRPKLRTSCHTLTPSEAKAAAMTVTGPVAEVGTEPGPGVGASDYIWYLEVQGNGVELETAQEELVRWFSEHGVRLSLQNEHEPELRPGSLMARTIKLIAGDSSKDEAYSIDVTDSSTTIAASGPRGVLHGVYALEEELARQGRLWLPPVKIERAPFLDIRILRSVWSPYYVDELTTEENYYPDGYLENLSRLGFNGIWLHGYLQHLAPSDVFPELSINSEPRLQKLRTMIAKAARYGIDVYIYFCEPKALPADSPFWQKHSHAKGTTSRGNTMDSAELVTSLCTSDPQVQSYIENAYYNLLRAVPGLGGVILITASENHSHCYSHGKEINCPRCAQRDPQEVVTELISLVRNGVRRADPTAQVIIWTWSWYNIAPDPQLDLISSIPDDVAIMSDFERGAEIERLGRRFTVNEYAMSVVGPSERFRRQMAAARSQNRRLFAKMQLSTTHELVTVPYYPVPWRMAEKWAKLKEEEVTGVLGCWIFGNYPSFVTEILRELTWEPHLPLEELLRAKVKDIFGSDHVNEVLTAWRHFGDAFDEYPFSNSVLYRGPMNRAPALLWSFPESPRPMPLSWRMALPGDSLDETWMRPFTADFILTCFKRFLETWNKGLVLLDGAVKEKVDKSGRVTPAGREYIVTHAVAAHIQSTVNFLRYAIYRRKYLDAGVESGTAERQELLRKMIQITHAEINNRLQYLPLVKADSRLGFHSEVEDYLFTASTLEASITQLQELVARLSLTHNNRWRSVYR